jgi:hypothetical protein
MAIRPPMDTQSILDLIASDYSYKSGVQNGELLQTYPDSDPGVEGG